MATDPRESKLPQWAQTELRTLRERVASGNEPLIREVAALRPQMALIKARNEALTELLQCAARGGHMTAQAVIEVIEGYDLVLVGLATPRQ